MGHSDINYSRIPGERINPALLEEVPELVAAPRSRRREELSKKLKSLSVVEIAFGIIAILLQIIIIVLNSVNWSILGCGIWSGTFLLVTGSLGVTAQKNPSPKIYNANLVFSIFSALAMSVVLSFSTLGATHAGLRYGQISSPSEALIASVVLSSILALVGLAGMVMSIIHSAYCCKEVCCINNEPQMVIVQNIVDPHHRLKNLSVVEIAFGSISILLQLVIIAFNFASSSSPGGFSILCSGIWCGTFLLITGSLGVTAQKNPSLKIYNANLVLSILSAVAMSVALSFSTMGAVDSGLWFARNSSPSGTLITAAMLSSILALVGLTGMVMSIIHTAYCCKGVCCVNTEPRMIIVQNNVDPHQMKQMVQLADGRFVLAPTQLGPDYGHVTQTSPACSSSPASGIPLGIGQREEMTATTWENPPSYSEDPNSDSQMLVA